MYFFFKKNQIIETLPVNCMWLQRLKSLIVSSLNDNHHWHSWSFFFLSHFWVSEYLWFIYKKGIILTDAHKAMKLSWGSIDEEEKRLKDWVLARAQLERLERGGTNKRDWERAVKWNEWETGRLYRVWEAKRRKKKYFKNTELIAIDE